MRRLQRLARHARAALFVAAIVAACAWSDALLWGEGQPFRAAGNILVGFGFAVTAVLLRAEPDQHRNAFLVTVLAVGWALAETQHRDLGPLVAITYLIGMLVPVVVMTIVLRYPDDHLEPLVRRFLWTCFTVSAAFAVAQLLVGRPQWSHADASGWWPDLWANRQLSASLGLARAIWWGCEAAVFVLLLIRRSRRLGALERRTLNPILITAVVAAAAVGLDVLEWILPRVLQPVLLAGRGMATALLAFGFLLSALRLRLSASRVARLIPRISGTATVDGVQDALRWVLKDPGLEVLYWLPARSAYIGGDGTARELPGRDDDDILVARAQSSDGEPLAAVLLDPSLRRHRDLVSAAVAVCGFALENARLQADLRAQRLSVQESTSRMVLAGDGQRRRLERDLHDGAQQRLLALGLRLGALRANAANAEFAAGVAVIQDELRAALGELRDLARGIHPAVLTEQGLSAAVQGLADRLAPDVTVDVAPGRFSPVAESTAYFVVCEAVTNAVKHAPGAAVAVLVEAIGGDLLIRVSDNGAGSEILNRRTSLQHLRDRVAAARGELVITSLPGQGTDVRAVIPC